VEHWFPEDLSPERIASTPLPQFGLGLGYDIYIPADGALNRRKLFGERHPVGATNDKEVDIAPSGICSGCVGPKYVGGIQSRQSFNRLSNQTLDAYRLLDKTANLAKQGGLLVDGVHKGTPNRLGLQNPESRQLREFTTY